MGPMVENVVFSQLFGWGQVPPGMSAVQGEVPQHFQLLHSSLDKAPQIFYIHWKLKNGCRCHEFILKNQLFFRSSIF